MDPLQIILVARLIVGCDEIIDESLAKLLLGINRIFLQAKYPLMTCLVENDREVVGHDVLVAHG